MKQLIYIADDEENICGLLRDFLQSEGYAVKTFPNGDLLLDEFRKNPCQLVILDVMMPGTDGLTICSMLRDITTVPIIILTAKDSEMDYVRGITLGSDDYLTKPFRPSVLLMKVHSLFRRVEMDKSKNEEPDEVTFGDLYYSSEKNAVFKNNTEINLTQTELKLLSYMLLHNEKSFSREELLQAVWGYDTEAETRVTDETLRRIRKKLSSAESIVHVQTIWGFGYKIVSAGE